MRLVAQMAVKQQFGVRDRDYPYVANGGSFSVDPSLEVALSLLGDDYKIMSRDGYDRWPSSYACLPQILLRS